MSENNSGKPQPRIEVDVSHMTPEQLRQLIDGIYAEVPGVKFTPASDPKDGIVNHMIDSLKEVLQDLEGAEKLSQGESPQTQTQERTQTQIQYPARYKVVFLNDDFTPMDFVIQLLVEIFNKGINEAHDITMEIHDSGSGIVGVYSLEIAEQKTHEALILCKHAGHPLEIIYEPA